MMPARRRLLPVDFFVVGDRNDEGLVDDVGFAGVSVAGAAAEVGGVQPGFVVEIDSTPLLHRIGFGYFVLWTAAYDRPPW